MNERIEELEEMKQEYILNETSLEIGQRSVSWGELAGLQTIAEAKWDNTPEGQELKALQWAEGNEKTMSLYYALKAMSDAFDIGQRATHSSAIGKCRAALREAEGDN